LSVHDRSREAIGDSVLSHPPAATTAAR